MLVRAVNKDGGTWIPNIEINPRKKDQEYSIYIREEDNPDTLSYKELRDQAVVEAYAEKEQVDIELDQAMVEKFVEKNNLADIKSASDMFRHLK